MKLIKNDQLKLNHIPNPDGELHGWEKFAHTINGYEAAGSFEACADLANKDTAKTLTELRCALFFISRADRHGGCYYDYSPQVRDLLRRIREEVATKKSTRKPRDL